MKIIFSILVSCNFILLSAQINKEEFVNDTSHNENQYWMQTYAAFPCFYSKKIDTLVAVKDFFARKKLSDSVFNQLNYFEHFIHAFQYPEWYYQSCSFFPLPDKILQSIPAYLKKQSEGFVMSN